MTLVVSDASPLIAFQQLDELDLLRGLFGEVVIAPAVAREVEPSMMLPPWIKTRSLDQPVAGEILHASLGARESEAISLAQELRVDWLLLDERAARRLAQALGLRVAGTLGLLNRAKEKALLTAARPRVEALLRGGFHATPAPAFATMAHLRLRDARSEGRGGGFVPLSDTSVPRN